MRPTHRRCREPEHRQCLRQRPDRPAVYDSAGARSRSIGAGSLGDGYGLAISGYAPTAGRLYVPDAASDTVKVYDPAVDTVDPVETIAGPPGGFADLHDSAVAVDDATGEVYVIDTLGPQHSETPQAIVYVFDAAGTYEGRLKYNVVNGGPSGLAVDNSGGATQGRVYVTSGITAQAGVYAYPPHAATSASEPSSASSAPAAAGHGLAAEREAAVAAETAGPPAPPTLAEPVRREIVQRGSVRVSLDADLSPRTLPRRGSAPIAVSLGWKVASTDGSPPPTLRSLRTSINRNGHFDFAGMPLCRIDRIQPGSSAHALSSCRSALVGTGTFGALVGLEGQEPYEARGRVLIFNGRVNGKPALLGHIYSDKPFANSFVIVFAVEKVAHGAYGTTLFARMPRALAAWGRLTDIQIRLSRRFTYQGKRRSYISAGCRLPKGIGIAPFKLARTVFSFDGGSALSATETGICKARGG